MKNFIVVLVVVLGLFIAGGVMYLHISYSQYINALSKGIAERDVLIAGRDNTIADLWAKVADLELAKSLLVGKLDGETLAKAAISENLNTLGEQFKDANRESMRVEGNLTEALDKAKAEKENLKNKLADTVEKSTAGVENLKDKLATKTEQLERVQAELSSETAAKVALQNKNSQLVGSGMGSAKNEVVPDATVPDSRYNTLIAENQVLWAKVKSEPVRIQVAADAAWMNGWGQGTKEVWVEANKWIKDQEIAYDTLIKGIEDLLLKGHQLNTGKSLKPIIFVPSDLNPTQADLDKDLKAMKRSLEVIQVWYQDQLGITFSIEEPIVFRSSTMDMYFDALPPGGKVAQVYQEVALLTKGKAFVAFLYGNSDKINWAAWSDEWRGSVITDYTREFLQKNNLQRYIAISVITHEIGHVWGLPDIINGKTLMGIDGGDGIVLSARNFPAATFSEQEKNILRRNLAK